MVLSYIILYLFYYIILYYIILYYIILLYIYMCVCLYMCVLYIHMFYIYIVDVRKSCQRVKRKVGMAFDVFARCLVHESCGPSCGSWEKSPMFFWKRKMYEVWKSLFQIEDLGDVAMDNYDSQNSHEGIWCFHQGAPRLALTARRIGLTPD